MKTFSLCITCYDKDFHLLDGLLKELEKQSEPPNEIIISASGLAECYFYKYDFIIIKNRTVPIYIVSKPQRHAQTPARNLGAEKSNCDVIIFFDVDDIPHPQKIEVTKKVFNSNEDIDAFVHTYTMGNFLDNFTEISNEVKIERITKTDPNNTNILADSGGHVHHGHLSVKKNTWKSSGGYTGGAYVNHHGKEIGEDGVFCQKLVKQNYYVSFSNLPLVHYNL
jgi:glycosyltransferase involved in cell wall biosynthesis